MSLHLRFCFSSGFTGDFVYSDLYSSAKFAGDSTNFIEIHLKLHQTKPQHALCPGFLF